MSDLPHFKATKEPVHDRGVPPDSFLLELLAWGRQAEEEVFAPNPNPADIYSLIGSTLGPWTGPLHRRAALLEAMRVHAGFESSWHWTEGVDTTNHTSMSNIEGQETGIFQVSFDSTHLGHGALLNFVESNNINTPQKFIISMKADHRLALNYYAHLVRINIQWAGPLKRKEILPSLCRASVAEFEQLLA